MQTVRSILTASDAINHQQIRSTSRMLRSAGLRRPLGRLLLLRNGQASNGRIAPPPAPVRPQRRRLSQQPSSTEPVPPQQPQPQPATPPQVVEPPLPEVPMVEAPAGESEESSISSAFCSTGVGHSDVMDRNRTKPLTPSTVGRLGGVLSGGGHRAGRRYGLPGGQLR